MTEQRQNPFKAGDIISFRFPTKEGGDGKARPCLIVDANEAEILVAYGSTSETGSNRGLELRINRQPAECGLHRQTRFICARRIRVAFDDLRVVFDGQGRHLIGQLDDEAMVRLSRLRGLIEEDGPEERRHAQERGGLHPGRQRKGYLRRPSYYAACAAREVVVETRRRKVLAGAA